jgi:glutamate 5-kinase
MPGQTLRRQVIAKARHIVVKVGTNAICDPSGRPDQRAIDELARQVAKVMQQGVAVTLVASGAIGSGVAELGLPGRPKTMPHLQAAAAVGQGQLMRIFHDMFAQYGLKVGQVLLTRDDIEHRTRYLNIRNTLRALGELKALPIINENDTVAVDEIRFGENDILAALVTTMLGADVAVFLTNVDGLIRDGQVVDVVDRVDDEALSLATPRRSSLGSGGMASKLQAVDLITRAGLAAVIANARTPDVLARLLAGQTLGTVFVPSARKMSSRTRWIAGAPKAKGKIVIDEGAARALVQRGTSLLPSGVLGVIGQFPKGAMVAVVDASGRQIARGLANYSSAHIDRIKGLKTSQIAKVLGDKPYDEVIHRNNMALG